MIVTDKYNEESSKTVVINDVENVSILPDYYTLYKFKDNSFCRPVVIGSVLQVVECDAIGDCWFTIPTGVLDSAIPDPPLSQLNTVFGSESESGFIDFVPSGTTLREIHKFVNDFGNGYSEIKSGIYPTGFHSRKYSTFDEEFQFYFDMFAAADLSNVSTKSNYIAEL